MCRIVRQNFRFSNLKKCSPDEVPSPGGRERIARQACANPEQLDSSQRGMRCSLSPRERARGRGNESQPTKTVGRILQAQLHRFPDSELSCQARCGELSRLNWGGK